MVRIRYAMVGRRGQKLLRLIAIDSRKKQSSKKILDYLGFYNPTTKEIKLHKEKIQKWINFGAQATKSVKELLIKNL